MFKVITDKIEFVKLGKIFKKDDILPTSIPDDTISFLLKHGCIQEIPDVFQGKIYGYGEPPRKRWCR